MLSPPVKIEAQRANLKILQPATIRDSAFLEELKNLNPSAIVVVAYGQILPRKVLQIPEHGCVNVHASLLPKYRGAAPINWAILQGEEKTGISTMLMDEGMDTGPILLQEEADIETDDTAGSLSKRLSALGSEVLVQTLKQLEQGRLKPRVQKGVATSAPVLKKSDALIQWSESAQRLCNLIRGMNPWPGAYSFLNHERIKLLRSIPEEGDAEPGMIAYTSKHTLLVGTGKGLLSVQEIQSPGKPIMKIREFLQGRNLKKGMRFIDEKHH
jgi:methionyl-tRNA formyltransferase